MKIAFCDSGDKYKAYYDALEYYGVEYEEIDENVNPFEYAGLIIPGGLDVNPKYYGQDINGTKEINDSLDQKELAIIDKFVKANKPILGICRGLQILNVYFGGTLIQDLVDKKLHTTIDRNKVKTHYVYTTKNSFLNELYNEKFLVNSFHHQGIDALGKGLVVVAKAEDEIIEACVHENKPIYMVQFHPERMIDGSTVNGYLIFQYFLSQCKKISK